MEERDQNNPHLADQISPPNGGEGPEEMFTGARVYLLHEYKPEESSSREVALLTLIGGLSK